MYQNLHSMHTATKKVLKPNFKSSDVCLFTFRFSVTSELIHFHEQYQQQELHHHFEHSPVRYCTWTWLLIVPVVCSLCRCVSCMQCGASSPGFHCEWQNNYTHCGPCASLVTCPVCRENFMEEELLLQCQHCDRWVPLITTTQTYIEISGRLLR